MARLVAALLREDDRRCLLGEDVRSGGMLGLSRVAAEDEQLRPRLLGSPLTGAGLVAHAGGLALAGLRPIVLLPSASALLEALPALRELGRLPWRSGGQHDVPVLFVAPNGPGFGVGGDQAECAEATLTAVPGVEVWCAGRAEDLCGYLRSAAEFLGTDTDDHDTEHTSGPRVLLLPRSVIVRDLMIDLDLDASLPRAPTAVLREGDRATVFAWGAALAPALAAADACARHSGIEVNVVELGCLAPLDEALLVELASATGKLVIAHAGPRRGGIGAELAALFADRSILHLDAPILRVTGELPANLALLAGHEEHRASPTATAIANAITHVVHY
ncbi:2-oxoisovalerate dehydrogenase subunit beta [Enhygromyxa salina]|uniref:3-methyl-2-oxobutanoate dehydrogenase (2-methylpropanoyl-transferring) n=2 Tax=Enhygromyxa salina TaxID=215803 RepID=A0A2S9YSG7_9BACT|nr:2-oxoisovalerate dehydrogenase subunit beta [Enhygromyxa salina]